MVPFSSSFIWLLVSMFDGYLFSIMLLAKFHFDCRIDMVEVLCNLVRNLSPYNGSVKAMAMSVTVLAKMMKW